VLVFKKTVDNLWIKAGLCTVANIAPGKWCDFGRYPQKTVGKPLQTKHQLTDYVVLNCQTPGCSIVLHIVVGKPAIS
jgi:hypothetical protein